MKRLVYLWHGSSRKSNFLKPTLALDLSGHPDSNRKGVYATDMKELAIGFGLVNKKFKKFADYKKKPVQMVLINGKTRKGKKFYLYRLSKKGFKEKPKNSQQWFNFKKVKPLEILELKVDDYSYLCRKASKKDKEHFKSLIGKFK